MSFILEENDDMIFENHDGFFIEDTLPDDISSEIIHDPCYKITGQVSLREFNLLSFEEQFALHASLNAKRTQVFVPCVERADFLGRPVIRLKQALEEKLIPSRPKDITQLYCSCCNAYRHFRHHPYLGYDRCIACGITTSDFNIACDNKLFHAESKKK